MRRAALTQGLLFVAGGIPIAPVLAGAALEGQREARARHLFQGLAHIVFNVGGDAEFGPGLQHAREQAKVFRRHETAAVMAGLGPRVWIVQERLCNTGRRKHVQQIAHIAGMQVQVGNTCRADLAQQHGDSVHKGLCPDKMHVRVGCGHVDQMFPAAKTNLKPEGLAAGKAKVQRQAAGVLRLSDTLQRQGAKIFGQIAFLRRAQGLAMGAAIKVAAGCCWGGLVLCHGAPELDLGGLSEAGDRGARGMAVLRWVWANRGCQGVRVSGRFDTGPWLGNKGDAPPKWRVFLAGQMIFTVAIDGPAAAGKGTIGRALAAKFGFVHLDTGLLYRAVGAKGGDPVEAALGLTAADLDRDDLRSMAAGQAASQVAVIPQVRAALVAYQRRIARAEGGAVLDGRDIGTVICPEAEVKLYVTASAEVRAQRRWLEVGGDLQGVLAEVRARDARDMERAEAPLRPAADAVILDTSVMNVEAAIAAAVALVRARLG